MRPPMSILVRANWDPEARVFVATSEDVPGLITEAATQEELLKKLEVMVPELLELNGITGEPGTEVPLYVLSEQLSKVRIPRAA